MRYDSYVSIIISDLETHQSLPRLLQTVALQARGLDRTEIVIAGSGGHPSSAESIWSAITGIDNVKLIKVPDEATPSQARNKAIEASRGDYLVLLRPDYRLDPKYMTTAFTVFEENPAADVMYSDYIRMTPKKSPLNPGMIQLPAFEEELLQERNIIGPAVMMRREAFERTQGFRDNTRYMEWDLWIQSALSGSEFYHVNYPLASCEHSKVNFRERAEDGRYKAMLVINNQSFFHMHTVRWALSYLRGDGWAQAFNFMAIPTAMEVSRMIHEHAMKQMGTDALAREAIRQFETEPLAVESRR